MQANSLKNLRIWTSGRATIDEREAVKALLEEAEPFATLYPSIFSDASHLLKRSREKRESALEQLLQQFSLESPQGVALMRLVEALPRIPDNETAYALIEEVFGDPIWEQDPEATEGMVAALAAQGLKIAHQLLEPKKKTRVKKVIKSASEPLIHKGLKQLVAFLGVGFVLGQDLEEAASKAKAEGYREFLYSFDMLGEAAKTAKQAEAYFENYLRAIIAAGQHSPKAEWVGFRNGVSVKLSALHPRFELSQRKHIMAVLYPRLKKLALAAKDQNILLTIDAEEASRFDITLELFEYLLMERDLQGFEGIGIALQAYQKRAFPALEYFIQLAKETGRKIPIRLVKGAYWDAEIKRAQSGGYAGYPVFTEKCYTDLSYLACARKILDNHGYLLGQFATHNAHTLSAILKYAKPHHRLEFQKLHGMADRLHKVIAETHVCRVYAPVGDYDTLLPYLIRRMLENGANTSFLHQLTAQVPERELLACPVAATRKKLESKTDSLPLPRAIYPDGRLNAAGIDLGNTHSLQELRKMVQPFQSKHWVAGPLINGELQKTSETRNIASPSDVHSLSGQSYMASELEVVKAVTLAKVGTISWQHAPVAKRAAILNKAADLLEKDSSEALALLIYEAGKTLPDALGEIRETIDFLRYYAREGERLMHSPSVLPAIEGEENQLHLMGRGVFLCISPWNFPLSIFTGQIAAALITGNTVLAKPAEQTPLIAFYMSKLLIEAGVPPYALQLLPGSGDTVGQRLVAEPAIDGVVFTGSFETARAINLTLAARTNGIIPFIAETGGQNAMIIDSSTLPEQAVEDILLSAFGSSGQRCSALRVLYVPQEIYKTFIPLLKDAAMEIKVGFPEDLDTDIPSVINPEAQARLLNHIAQMKKDAKLLFQVPTPAIAQRKGCFVPPTGIELKSIRQLKEEVFGPVLHIIPYKWKEIGSVIAEINNTGYALTFGIHSRVESRVKKLAAEVRAGNIYINRGMTGAVVGQQPFGGYGLSGTGFKAGGAHYLSRFVTETSVTTNTAAFGGNIGLLRRKHGN